ncbi:P2X purinoceptor 7-like [Anneissia japonica]|uniref:P2X purinoceptor 7-like n=1 Tax=Anneissia japonica TaxID=1529436 RepID=UPI0014258D9F|nr:P2X purinoceptor 7-like [Anneissia japonica]
MPTAKECICCNEVTKINEKMEKVDMKGECITHHPGFRDICLNEWVLQVAYLAYRQQYGAMAALPHSNEEQYRHVAYRNLVRFCWGYLGRENRVVLPSCAVAKIRQQFPNPENDGYTGFQRRNIAEI